MGVPIAQVLASISGLCILLGILGQVSAEPIKPHPCGLGLVERINPKPSIHNASKASSQVPPGSVRVTFVDHSTFQIETPQGISAATDYAGLHIPGRVPTIVTMNNSHSSHHTTSSIPRLNIFCGLAPLKLGLLVTTSALRIYEFTISPQIFSTLARGPLTAILFLSSRRSAYALPTLATSIISESRANRSGGQNRCFVCPHRWHRDPQSRGSHAHHRSNQSRVVMPMHMSFAGADKFPEIAASSHKVKYLGTNTMLINRSLLPGKTEIWFLVTEL